MKRFFVHTVALLLVAFSASAGNATPGTFAQCLAQSGAVMYSAWWCPYCLVQLRKFEPSLTKNNMQDEEKLREKFPFVVECAGANEKWSGKCPKYITGDTGGVPTWELDGEILSGVQKLATLSEKTGCPLAPEQK